MVSILPDGKRRLTVESAVRARWGRWWRHILALWNSRIGPQMGQAGEVVGAGRLAAGDLLQGLESLGCGHDCQHKAPDLDE
jgi:hypothetical protein